MKYTYLVGKDGDLEVSWEILAALVISQLILFVVSQVRFMRKSGLRLNVFAPVADLSAISKGESGQAPNVAGGRVLGDEWTEHVVKVRA